MPRAGEYRTRKDSYGASVGDSIGAAEPDGVRRYDLASLDMAPAAGPGLPSMA